VLDFFSCFLFIPYRVMMMMKQNITNVFNPVFWEGGGGALAAVLMRPFLVLTLISVFLLAHAQVYLPLSNDEVVDHPIVEVQVGVPPQTLRLALALDHGSVSPLCDASLEFVLFEPSQTFRHKSRSYQTIVPQLSGQDVAEIAGTRFWANVGFDPLAGVRFSSLFPSISPAVDGVFCLGTDTSIHSPLIWRALVADRHGVRLYYDSSATTSLTGSFGKTFAMIADAKYGWMGCIDSVQASIGSMRTQGYRLCLLPHASSQSYLPQALYDQYWSQVATSSASSSSSSSSSLYASTSTSMLQWPSLRLATEDSSFSLNLGAAHILPLIDGMKSLDLTTGLPRQATTSSTGGDVLKLLSHRQSNETRLIVLAGHTLWSSTQVLLAWDESSSRVQLFARSRDHERLLTSWQALLVLLVVFLYIRWKMLRQRFDALVFADAESAYDYTIHYRFKLQSGAENLIWPWLVPIWLVPLVYLTRAENAMRAAADSPALETFEAFAAVIGLMAYGGMAVIMLLIDGHKTWRAWTDLARWMRRRVFSRQAPWYQALLPAAQRTVAVTKSQHGEVVWRDADDYQEELRYQGVRKRERQDVYPLYEHNLAISLLRDAAIDFLMGATVWLFFGPLHSRTLSQPIIFISLAVIVFVSAYHFFLYLMALVWPMVASKRAFGRVRKRLRPSTLEWLTLFVLGGMVCFVGWFLVVACLRSLLELLGSTYTATTLTFSLVVIVFLASLAVVSNSIADFDLQTRLFSPESEQDIADSTRTKI
jgi:hypothetical protein